MTRFSSEICQQLKKEWENNETVKVKEGKAVPVTSHEGP
jgi:hypothetical protein